MTVAIVHDFLTQRGGAERVVLHIASRVRDPVIVTSLFAPSATYPEFTSLPVWADRIVSEKEAERFRRGTLTYGRAFRRRDLSFADAVIVSTSAFAHHVRSERALVYWYTPPRYLYDPGAYFTRPAVAKAFEVATMGLRRQDRRAALSHPKNLAVSARTATRLRAAYGFDAGVLYPPFESERFAEAAPSAPEASGSPRALVVSRLLPYKRVDLAIAACAEAGVPLTVIGQGPEEDRLRSLASGSVTFVPRVSHEELLGAYDSHSVVLVPGVEDFGYVPLEAAARGRPVVATREGGSAETVDEHVTGLLVSGEDPVAWAAGVRNALESDWDPAVLRQSVERFDAAHFDEGLTGGLCAQGDDHLIDCFVTAHAWGVPRDERRRNGGPTQRPRAS